MQRFNKLHVADMDEVSKTVANSLVMYGSSNWDFYFAKKPRNTEFDELSNVALLEFGDKASFNNFLKNNTYIDYSLEHEKPCVLIHGQNKSATP